MLKIHGVCGTPEVCTFENAVNYDPEAFVEDNSCEWSCPLTYGGVHLIQRFVINMFWSYGYLIDDLESVGWDCSCVEEPSGCYDVNACNYSEDESCYYPEYDCDCEGNIPQYSNVGWEVDLVAVDLIEDSEVYITGSWHNSLITSEIYINLQHGWDNTAIDTILVVLQMKLSHTMLLLMEYNMEIVTENHIK